MKNKKIIAFLCALSMIASMFSMMTAYADATIGYAIAGSLSEDGKTVTVDVTLDGVSDNTVTAGQINVNAPAGVTELSQITAECPGNSKLEYDPNLAGGVVYMNFANASGYVIEAGKIAKITFTLATPLASDYTAAIQAESNLISKSDGAGDFDANTLKTTSDTVEKWKDPNAKSDKEERPVKQEETGGETPKDVTTDKLGLNITGEVSKDNKTVTVNVDLSGVTDNTVTAGQININAPAGVTELSQITAECPGNSKLEYDPNLAGGIVYMNFANASGYEIADGKLAKITFNLGDTPLKDTYVAKLQAESNLISKSNGAGDLDAGTMDATQAVISPAEAEKGDATEVDLEDFMGKDTTTGKDAATVAKEAEDAGKTIYVTVDVTKENEAGERVPAVYGTDYEAEFNGETLTEAEYNNLIHGYTDTPISEVISGLKFKVYDTANGVKIKTSLNSTTDDTQLVNDQENEDVDTTPVDPGKDYSAKGKIASNVSKSIKSTDKKQSATFTITPAKDKNGAEVVGDATVTINVKRTSFDAITGSGIEVAYQTLEEDDDQEMDIVTGYQYLTINDAGYEYELPESLNDKYIVSFTPAAKGTVEYVITYTDANGDKSTATAKYTVSTSSTSGSGSSSSSSSKDDDNKSSGGGAIATGLVDSGSGYLPSLGFDDLGDVEWAQTAINSLAAKKIVSGVGDNKFDPNAALTRAAYAQMLVNAIGHSQDSADVEFDDVPTDAWFYHNVAVAAQLGIVAGFGDGTFRPYDLITREQMALMTQKAAVVMGKSLIGADNGTFTDDADIADWAHDAVYTLSNAGIINGMGDGSFAPQANATRAQAAVIIYNTFVK